MLNLHIITLNWNGKDKLQKLYNSLLPNLNNINYKWTIKDNGSKDGSCLLEQEWNNSNINFIKYTHNNDNFSAGCNLCVKESNPKEDDFILLLNNDVVFNNNSNIRNMLSLFKDNVGVVGSKLKYLDNTLQHAGVVFSQNSNKLPYHFRAREKDDKYSTMNREFQAITGAVLLTKAKYYNEICKTNKSGLNGLNESFFWAFEDIDACLEIKYNLNKKIIYCGENDVIHEESASLKKNPVNKLFLNQNSNYFKNKWYNKIIVDNVLYNNKNYNVL